MEKILADEIQKLLNILKIESPLTGAISEAEATSISTLAKKRLKTITSSFHIFRLSLLHYKIQKLYKTDFHLAFTEFFWSHRER